MTTTATTELCPECKRAIDADGRCTFLHCGEYGRQVLDDDDTQPLKAASTPPTRSTA